MQSSAWKCNVQDNPHTTKVGALVHTSWYNKQQGRGGPKLWVVLANVQRVCTQTKAEDGKVVAACAGLCKGNKGW
jgi:hypothetical protein